jgi:predicted CoA-binding protein
VAVNGASDDATRHGHIVLNNLRDTGFRNCARAVNGLVIPVS